jgi:hypothetical protein
VADDIERENKIEGAEIRGNLAGEKEAFRGVAGKALAAGRDRTLATSMPT